MSRREREYTPEEAFALTMIETVPHWYGTSPLVVGVDLNDQQYPQPLDPVLNSGTWVFFFVSATGTEFFRAREIFHAWMKRYQSLGVNHVFSFRGHYPYFSERKTMESWVSSLDLGSPAVCDLTGSLARSFGASTEPAIAILSEGKVAFADSSALWAEKAEAYLQSLLRLASPGLPFWPVLHSEQPLIRTVDRWPLHENARAITSKLVTFVGNWEFDDKRASTTDSEAQLHFTAPASAVTLVGRSLSDTGDVTRIRIDSEGVSFSDTYAGNDFVVDSEGNSSLLLSEPRGYFVLQNLLPALRRLRFRFPYAKVNSVAVYGLEFGDPDSRK